MYKKIYHQKQSNVLQLVLLLLMEALVVEISLTLNRLEDILISHIMKRESIIWGIISTIMDEIWHSNFYKLTPAIPEQDFRIKNLKQSHFISFTGNYSQAPVLKFANDFKIFCAKSCLTVEVSPRITDLSNIYRDLI